MSDIDEEDYVSRIKIVDLRPLSLENAILEIEKTPGLWLPHPPSLENLYSFIVGWLNANVNYRDEEVVMNFNEYVLSYYGEENSAMGWREMISSKDDGNDEEKMKKFYSLYSEFLKTRSVNPS